MTRAARLLDWPKINSRKGGERPRLMYAAQKLPAERCEVCAVAARGMTSWIVDPVRPGAIRTAAASA